MNRVALIGFGIILLAISIFGVHDPSDSMQWLFGANPEFNYLRLGAASLLLAYGFLPEMNYRSIRTSMIIIGVFLPLLGLLSIFTSMSNLSLLPLDHVSFSLSGIVSLLLALEPDFDEPEPEVRIPISVLSNGLQQLHKIPKPNFKGAALKGRVFKRRRHIPINVQ